MGKDKHKSGEEESTAEKGRKEHKSKRRADDGSESEYDSVDGFRRSGGSKQGKSKKKMSRSSKRRRSGSKYSDDSYSSDSYSDSEDLYSESDSGSSEYSESDSGSESEEERRRRKRRERMKKEEREKERRRKRKREKEKRRRNKEKEEEIRKKKKKDKKKAKDKGKTGAVTNSWGKYGIIRETDMWNKRPEFTAWLAEVKQVNLESLPNWEEKQMFKVFMEDHNTATFPSKKYYDLDVYYRRKMEKEMKKGFKKVVDSERIVFNDEEQRRRELLEQREKHKEEQLETLKRSMQGGMAQAMKEQARLREEMAYQYKLGNFEAAAAIQRRLDPDVAM